MRSPQGTFRRTAGSFCTAVAALFILIATPAQAAPITYAFTGTIDFLSVTPSPTLDPTIAALGMGTQFSGTFTYWFDTPPVAQFGNHYVGTDANNLGHLLMQYSVSVGGMSMWGDQSSGMSIGIGSPTNTFFGLDDTRPRTNTINRSDESIFAFQFAPGAFATNALPGSLNPGMFTGGRAMFEFIDRSCCNSISGRINSLQAVPEPSAILLLTTGLGLAAGRRLLRRGR